MPHAPHNPLERLLAKYRDQVESLFIAKYYAMCEWFDETCGKLIDHIDHQGLTQNTLIVYVGDNGWIQDPAANGYAPPLQAIGQRRWHTTADNAVLAGSH